MRYKAALLIGFLILSLTLVTIPKVRTQEENQNIYYETRDLGWITKANSSDEVEVEIINETALELPGASISTSYMFYLYNEWEVNATTGTILPVNLTIIMPKEASPGENITIQIGISSLLGSVFFYLSGYHYLETEINFEHEMELLGEGGEETNFEHEFHFLLELLSQYMQEWNISLETPIGYYNEIFENVTMHLGNFSLSSEIEYAFKNNTEIETELEIEANVSVDLRFDLEIIANTSVVGTVNATGDALSEDLEYTLVWNSEGLKSIELPISPNATEGSGVNISVGLEYVVHEFRVIYKNISIEINVDIYEFEQEFEQEFDEEMESSTIYRNQTMSMYYEYLKQEMLNLLMNFLEEYMFTNWVLPFNVTKSVPIDHEHDLPHPLESDESNTIESSSPVESFVLAFSTAIISVVSKPAGEEGGIHITLPSFLEGLTGLMVISSIIAAIIVIAYVARRKNH